MTAEAAFAIAAFSVALVLIVCVMRLNEHIWTLRNHMDKVQDVEESMLQRLNEVEKKVQQVETSRPRTQLSDLKEEQ